MPKIPEINRRNLLTAVVAVTTSRVVGPIDTKVAVGQAAPLALSAALPISPATRDIVTATRLAEIIGRNRLRNEFGLPLLSVAAELRRMKTAADTEKVERFCSALREPVFQKLLTRARRQRGDTAWTPKGFCERWQFSNEVEMRLRRLYERVG
jgi:hypothetical protein